MNTTFGMRFIASAIGVVPFAQNPATDSNVRRPNACTPAFRIVSSTQAAESGLAARNIQSESARAAATWPSTDIDIFRTSFRIEHRRFRTPHDAHVGDARGEGPRPPERLGVSQMRVDIICIIGA
ncbi:hypothetical protein GCM10017714_08280 [Curtobacterium pusillum]|nr:hypothetical protein [Curtobacterium pusillum]GLK30091.1 hypothetical protein GCM10017610_03760 [Curtobacterium pusillum]